MRSFGQLMFGAALVAALPVAASAASLITNGSFEAPTTGSYAYPGATVDSWTYQGAGVISGSGGGAWFGSSAPSGYDGAQFAFVQTTGSLTQAVTIAAGASNFELSWLESARPDIGCCAGNQQYNVIVDGNIVGSAFATISGQNFVSRSLLLTGLTAGTHDIGFRGLSQSDNTAFFDQVALGAVPEPASWALMLGGFGMIGGAMRARRRTTVAA